MAKAKEKERRQLDAVIYARRSSDRQNEESTAQQIAACRELADRLGYNVIHVYPDEAKTGKNDRRPEFQKMVRAIEAGKCDVVLAYKSNRISRNMLQALTYENRFEQHGVKVVYAKEQFGDNAAGRFALRNMMNLNQFYSENMSEDIKRCLYTYAEECKVLSGRIPLGYKKGEDGKYALVEDEAKIVQEIFAMYCAGVKSVAICAELNARGLKTSRGKPFGVSTIERIIKQEKYIGVYTYGDIRIEGGVPRIVDDDTFRRAQERLKDAHRAPAKASGQTDYLLTGKLFCGHCGSTMIGECGTGRTGTVYNYYCCRTKKKDASACTKKRIRQDVIEDAVIDYTLKHALTDDIINAVAEEAIRLQGEDKRTVAHQQRLKQLAELRQREHNIIDAIASGFRTDAMRVELENLAEEISALSKKIAEESCERPMYTKQQLVDNLSRFKTGDPKSPKFRKQLVDIFVNSIYLFDDHFVIAYHTGDRQNVLTYTVMLDIDAAFECSSLSTYGSPYVDSSKHFYVFGGLYLCRCILRG